MPVISGSTPANEIYACLKYLTLWRRIQILLNERQSDIFSAIYWKQRMANTELIRLQDELLQFSDNQRRIDSCSNPKYSNQFQTSPVAKLATSARFNKPRRVRFQLCYSLTQYKSIHSPVEAGETVNYKTEFLTSLDSDGLPLPVKSV